MRSDIVPSGILSDYQLPDHTDEVQKLSELQGDDPMILTLARGYCCPKEHQQHFPITAGLFRRISTSRNTPIPSTIR